MGTLPEGVGLAVGTEAPGLTGTDHEGRPVELGKLLDTGEVLVVFYRGGWCPYCNFQIRELTEGYPELEKRGFTPVAVSVDRVEEAARTQASYSIPFPVVADPKLEWHRAFRVLNELDEAQVGRLKGLAGPRAVDKRRRIVRDDASSALPVSLPTGSWRSGSGPLTSDHPR